MAIFRYNEELDAKGSRVAPNKVKGWKKTALAIMGYKDTGERNQWGKISSILPNPVGTVAKHQIAKGLAKGTDTGKVLKETQDENLAMGMSQLKTGIEAGKLLMGGGLGLGGGVGIASAGALGTGTGSQIASKGLQSGGLGGGLSSPGFSAITPDTGGVGSGLMSNSGGGVGGNFLAGESSSSLDLSKPSGIVKKMMDDEETQFLKDDLMKKAEETDVSDIIESDDETPQGLKKGGSKYLDALEKGVPLLEAGLEQYAATKDYNKALEDEYKQYTAKTVKKNTANII